MKRIIQAINEASEGLTVRELATKAKLPKSTVEDLRKGKVTKQLQALEKLCKVLKIKVTVQKTESKWYGLLT